MNLNSDPIVRRIPISISKTRMSMHLLQYTSHKTVQTHPSISELQFRPSSKVWELELNLSVPKEFLQSKKGANITTTTVKGVGIQIPGQYVIQLKNNHMTLVPIDSVVQLKPYFSEIDLDLQNQHDLANAQRDQKSQVVEMSVKSTKDSKQKKLGSCLTTYKLATEEPVIHVKWENGKWDNIMQRDEFKEEQCNINVSNGLRK